jgi:tRNA/tmRNA/rRNA uracil-C5-methylase (TrmA/RlmC/RlmD family)
MGKKKPKNVPKQGDPDYLTPTQLRNRRKRRAKQQANASGAVKDASNGRQPSQPPLDKKCSEKDPSSLYLTNPMKAPLVEAARQFLQPILQPSTNFHVHVGPVTGWRTVSKLAVRPAPAVTDTTTGDDNKHKKVAIGLFLPQSHKLVPVPNCVAHHPSINHAVECITNACHDVGISPYRDNSNNDDDHGVGGTGGVGQLRYVAINVSRETGGVQITLVWNTSSSTTTLDDVDAAGTLKNNKRKQFDNDVTTTTATAIDDPDLEKLVNRLISMSVNNDDNADDGISPTSGDVSMKKRRRRGRQEGKSSRRGESDNNDIDWYENNDTKVIDRDSHGQEGDRSNEYNNTKYKNKKQLNLHSLWINYNQTWKHSNAIFAFDSTCWHHVHGPRTLIEYLKFDHSCPSPPPFAIPLHFPPNVFRQANLDAFTYIVGRIRERMIRRSVVSTTDIIGNVTTTSVVELYGGVGTIGLHITDLVSSLVCSDENPNNAQCFYDTVHALPPDIQSKCVYLQKNAASMIMSELTLLRKCQVLIVDPPRKGLDVEVVNYLCNEGNRNITLIVYVSCGFQAFKRDCDALLKCGKWKVDFAEGYLLFPGSDAIETLAFFVPT